MTVTITANYEVLQNFRLLKSNKKVISDFFSLQMTFSHKFYLPVTKKIKKIA